MFPHPSKLELINTGHAAGYTAVHWSPKRSCDARKPRSTTNSGSKGPRIVAAMTEGFVVGSPDWPDWTPAPLPARLADAIDRRSSNTKAGTGEDADDDANPPFGQAHCGDDADSRSRARDHATGVP